MAKQSSVKQPQNVNHASGPTSATLAPKLYWPRCDANVCGADAKVSRHEKFPFRYLRDVASSISTYPDEFLVDPLFLNELCNSKKVVIIQKTFTITHYKTLITSMKERGKSGNLQTKTLIIISKKHLGANCIGNNGNFAVKSYTKLFTGKNDFHDRIVILDGKIWHFGATVCGMHRTPHAYSGPWIDIDSSLMEFIDEIVNS